MRASLVAAMICLWTSGAMAQGGISSTTGTDPQGPQSPAVDVGSSTTSATTTGSSGKQDEKSEQQEGRSATSASARQSASAPLGPPTEGFQCARIADATARDMCESRARRLSSPADLLDREPTPSRRSR